MKYIDEKGNIVEAKNYMEAARKLYGEIFYQNPAHKEESLLSTLSLDYSLPVTVSVYHKGDKQGPFWGVQAATPEKHTIKPYDFLDASADFVVEGTPIRLGEDADFEYRSDRIEPNNYVMVESKDVAGNIYAVYYYVSDEEYNQSNWDYDSIDWEKPCEVVLIEEID